MQKFNNPLNNIKIAAPCSADWNKMYGTNRQRFCGACKLNVYNLSDMTRDEAESFLINSEGRVCVKFYRRRDGTVLTQNCPVGWQAVKKRISRVTTAIFSTIVGLFSGIFGFNQIYFDTDSLMEKVAVLENKNLMTDENESVAGEITNLNEVKIELKKEGCCWVEGCTRHKNFKSPENEPVVAWIQ